MLRFATILLLASLASAQAWREVPGSIYALEKPWGQCTTTSWPVTDIGQSLQPQEPDEELQDMLAQVSPERIGNIIATLTNFGTRHTLSNQADPLRGIGAARDWIYKELQALVAAPGSTMDVYFDSYIQPIARSVSFPVNITNFVARINGTGDPNRVYVITGHYDSRRLDVMDYTNDAPGSDDDASGVAVLIEIARICATKRPAATMIFAAVAGEEQGLLGSNHLATTPKNASMNVEAHFNNDIVGTGKSEPYAPINDHTVRLHGASILYPNSSTLSTAENLVATARIGAENDSPSRNLGRYISEIAAGGLEHADMQVALIYRDDRYLRSSDQNSFLIQGFPAVRFAEAVEDFAHEHQDVRVVDGRQYGDLLEFVDFEYVSRVAKVNLASMWSAANAPAMPKNVTISTTYGFTATDASTPSNEVSNDSQFSWIEGNDPLAAGYELVWRASGALQWSSSLALNGSPAVVALDKNHLNFGIRAVGKDGKKSPAVLPMVA